MTHQESPFGGDQAGQDCSLEGTIQRHMDTRDHEEKKGRAERKRNENLQLQLEWCVTVGLWAPGRENATHTTSNKLSRKVNGRSAIAL